MRYFFLLSMLLMTALANATESPITSGYGADGPYVGSFTTFTLDNPASVGVSLKPVRAYVSDTAPAGKRPLLVIAHAYGGEIYQGAANGYLPGIYPDLTKFALGKGWSVVFVPYPTSGVTDLQRYDVLWAGIAAAAADADAGARIDTTRIGIFGHSFGGGATPWLTWKATVDNGWGANGCFAMACAPWYTFRMTPDHWSALPSSMDYLVQVYDQDDTNDHTIAIKLYQHLELAAAHRDFVRLSGGSGPVANHATPSSAGPANGVLNDLDWYGVERLVDALADHAWHGNDSGRDTAIGHGSTAQTTMPSPTSLVSLWDAPVAQQPSPQTFSWSDLDTWQKPPTVTLETLPTNVRTGTEVDLSATAAGEDGAQIITVTFAADGDTIASDDSTPYSATWTATVGDPVSITAITMDENGRSATASHGLTVRDNQPPVATSQSVSLHQDATKLITLTGSDPDGDTLTYHQASAPAHGTLSGPAATPTYTPSAGYTGSDSFTFTVNDGHADSPPATVSLTVTAGPTDPGGAGGSTGGDSGGGGCGTGSGIAVLVMGFAVLLNQRRRATLRNG